MVSRIGAGLGAVGLAGAFLVASAAGAGAIPVGLDCKAAVGPPINSTIEVDGDPNTAGRQPQVADFTVNAPAEAETGSVVTITLPSGTTNLPDESTGLKIDRLENIATSYKVEGATIISGSVAADGPPVINGVPGTPSAPIVTADTITIGVPGPIIPVYVAGAGGGATLQSPTVTFQVTAGAVGSVITVVPGGTTLTAFPIIGAPVQAITTCTPPPNSLVGGPPVVLSSTNVVAPPPPPPGAPDAVVDNVTTNKNTELVIDVLANDTPDVGGLAIDKDSLEITTDPVKGEAVVNDDYTITYTPDPDVTGVDTFRYALCSVPDLETETPGACDSATVNVTIVDPDAVPATTTTTAPPAAAAATTTTTAAPAQLPRTGGSTVPLAVMGATILSAGFALVLRARRDGGRLAS